MRRVAATAALAIATAAVVATAALTAGAASPAASSASCSAVAYSGSTLSVRCSVPALTVTRTVTAPATLPSTPPTSSTTPTSTTTPSGGFPTAATTGVPAGTALTTVNGDLTASGSVTGKTISGDLVASGDVTVTKSRIKGRVVGNGHQVTLVDVDLGPDRCPSSGGDFKLITAGDFTLTRVHAHSNGEDLIGLGHGTETITDSLIDGTCFYPGAHLDTAQFYDPGAVGHITLRHNSLDVRASNATDKGNAAVFIADRPAPSSTFVIDNNLLAGGNYTVSLYDAGQFTVTDNVFVAGSYQYGPCITNTAITFTGNRLSTGQPVNC